MNLYVKYNIEKTCRIILQEQLDKFNLDYVVTDSGCVQLYSTVPDAQYHKIKSELNRYGIDIIDNKKEILVQKVKTLISSILASPDTPSIKISAFLSQEIKENYRVISQVFHEACHMSIESFIILHKIEKVKQLLTIENLSLTEISFKLHYSSVAHLSNQFKKITGLTPTTFQKLANHRRNLRPVIN